jgi:hypothetical protein
MAMSKPIYEVRRHVLDLKGALQIDETKCAELEHAQDVLSHGLYMEEKLDQVLENFVEYEAALLGTALSRLVFARHDLAEFNTDICLINRRLINLLSTCRAYFDQIPRHVGVIYEGSGDGPAVLRTKIEEQRNSVFGHRVMEALRNYAQHRGSPIESSEFSETCEWQGQRPAKVFSVDPCLEPARLSRDARFKKEVLREMAQQGEVVYLKPLVREYISSIQEVHRSARELVTDRITGARNTVESAIKGVDPPNPAVAPRMSAIVVAVTDGGKCKGRLFLSLDPERRREVLCRRNVCAGDLRYRFVSGACKDDT